MNITPNTDCVGCGADQYQTSHIETVQLPNGVWLCQNCLLEKYLAIHKFKFTRENCERIMRNFHEKYEKGAIPKDEKMTGKELQEVGRIYKTMMDVVFKEIE